MAIGRELLVIFAVGTLGLVQGFGLGPSLEWKDGDAEMWAQVPEIAALVSSAPPSKVFVEWPSNIRVDLNDSVGVGRMQERPRLVWPTEKGALYSVIIVDVNIERVLPKGFFHWAVINIPGNRVMEYVPPFHFKLNEDGSLVKDPQESASPMLVLVFKQEGRIWSEETHAGCDPEIVERMFDYRELAEKYNLEVVAGNFFQVPWSGFWTKKMICRISLCVREQWPFPMPGVNDLPECKSREAVMDITVDSPNLEERDLYAYWHSPFSVLTAIKDLYPTWTTGKVQDFSAKSGSYNAPYLTENQADTLSGVFDATFLEYPTKEKAKELFKNAVEIVPSAAEAFSSGAYAGDGRPYKIILAEPNNQDWDLETVLNKEGMVMEMFMVKMFEGKEEQHHTARAEFIALTRNLNDVIGVYTFEVDQEILEPSDPFYYDSTNNEIMIVVYPSAPARNRAQGEMYQHAPDVFGRLSSSFECVMCAVLEKNYHPTFYGPFP